MGVLSILSGLVSMTTVYLIIAVIVICLVYDYWTHTYFKRLGIPGPHPKPIFGNAGDFNKPLFEVVDDYVKEYGPVLGFYIWRRPILVVTDLDALRTIMVKDAHRFYNKYQTPLSSGVMDLALFLLRDSQWKRVRDVVSPTFTGKKMKMMSDTINNCADTMVEKLQQSCEKDGTLETLDLYGSFVMDSVASCGFGLKVNSQKDKDHPFVKHVARFFKFNFGSLSVMTVSFMPCLRSIFTYFNVTLYHKDVIAFFSDVTEKAVALRESSTSEQRVDFLQLLIDAKNGQNQTVNENDDDDIHNKYFKDSGADDVIPTKTQKYITREELLAQSMIFLAAGYETTTSLLTFTSYLLATNPDQQDKLIAEIDDVAPTRDDVSYTTISKMPYLDQVVCEVLRIYPPAALVDRECGETCTHKGYRIEKGIQVWIPSYTLHRDPDHWPDPTKFDPERFSKKNREGRNPFTWIPFGAGPRICIAMRFALMEAKMALVRSLQVVRFEVSPQTKPGIKCEPGRITKASDHNGRNTPQGVDMVHTRCAGMNPMTGIPPDVGNFTLLPKDGITLKVVQRQ